MILRIGDRNLLPTVRSDDFLAQLSSYRLKRYIDERWRQDLVGHARCRNRRSTRM